jgi:hypothetical protein
MQTMSFWSSDRDPVAAVTVLRDVGRALSELKEGELVKEHTCFLENLKHLLEAVKKTTKEGLLPHALQENITAIWKSLLDTEVEVVSSMGLNEDEVKTEDMKSVTSKFYMKIAYYERFSSKMIKLRREVATPLLRLHSGVTMIFSQNPSRSWETIERWTAESKRYTEHELVDQIKQWLRPKSQVQDIYHTYTNEMLSSHCDWFFLNKEYTDWSHKHMRRGAKALWISGIFGIRKTQIAARVIERLRKDKYPVAYFFFRGTFSEEDVRSVIATLCWELLNQFPEDVGPLSEVFNKGCDPTESNIRNCLQLMCQKRHTTILLDSLDQFSFDTVGDDKLCRILESLKSVCDFIVFGTEFARLKRRLTGMGEIPPTMDCGVDFWKEMEEISTRHAAGLEASDEKTVRGGITKTRAYKNIEERDVQFPVTKEDQLRVYAMMRDMTSGLRLPAHVARQIIDQAEYWVKSTFERREPLNNIAGEAKRDIPYLLSDPIDGAGLSPVRKIITACSHDQVRREYPDKNGSYKGSDAYFDLIQQGEYGSISEVSMYGVHDYLRTQQVNYWLSLIRRGDRLGMVPKTIASGLLDLVEMVRIDIFSTFIAEDHEEDYVIRRTLEHEKMRILGQIRNSANSSYSVNPTYSGITLLGPGKLILTASIKMIQKLLRPGVRPGFRRLEWTCVSNFLQPPATYTH